MHSLQTVEQKEERAFFISQSTREKEKKTILYSSFFFGDLITIRYGLLFH
jgi:hypothetical protein